MGRIDKYEDKTVEVLTRTKKNEELYQDGYLNNKVVDLNHIIENNDDDETLDETDDLKLNDPIIKELTYEEKSYSLDDFIKNKRASKVIDNLPRSLDEKIIESSDEISKLILDIENKEKKADLFNELLPDGDNTVITEAVEEEKLDNIIDDDAINNFVMHKDINETNSFMEIEETKVIKKINKKNKKLRKTPLIFFMITFILLIIVVVYIIVK